MADKGWNAEIFYEGDEVLMIMVGIEGMGTFFRYEGEWDPSMPDDMDLSDSEVVSIKGDDLKDIVARYDEKDPSLVEDLKKYEGGEE